MSEPASKRILMVEDEEDIAFLIRYMLEQIGRASCRERV